MKAPTSTNPNYPFNNLLKAGLHHFRHAVIAASLALLGWSANSNAQGVVKEDFDSGALSPGWQERNVMQSLGGYVSDTFVPNGSGLALRLQRGSGDMSQIGFPQQYGTGRGWLFRTNVYSDFYVAMDIVNWNDTTNQALVLLARASGFDDAPFGIPGLAAVNGYVLNYDNLQDGGGPGDRRGGELQINFVSSEAPGTLCAAEVTLIVGHSYRMVFTGVGSTLTGRMYDLEDLTKPIVTVVTEDTTYGSGNAGIVTFHRDDNVHPNRTDMTVDNYYSAESDPDADIAPAIRHPISGTPQVVTRIPSSRFTNFHPIATGISFTAKTFTADQINASATKLYLNGADVSSSLVLPSNGSTISVSLGSGVLQANTLYNARIELVDTTGLKKSTNTFWFDTYTETYLATAPVQTIEAEDYNYSNGVYQLAPIPVSGLDTNGTLVNGSAEFGGNGLGYYGMTGTPGVDYSKPAGHYRTDWAEYRSHDRVQITQGSYSSQSNDEGADILDAAHPPPFRIHDTQRAPYRAVGVPEYQVRLTSPGDWMNYTRDFAPGNYYVLLRCGTFGSTTVYLDKVTSDTTVTNQTTARLGTFDIGNHIMRLNYKYEVLMNGASPAVVTLSGTNTIRLTMGGTVTKDDRLIVMDYLVFIPTTRGPTIFDGFSDGNDTANPAWDHYDPIGGLTAPPATFSFPDGHYRIVAPAPAVPDAYQARAGSFVHDAIYSDFYVSADLIDFDDSVRQAFGIAARINTPGLGTTGGYLFSWEPGGGTLPGTNNGDLDISVLLSETPVGQIETAPSGLHLQRGKSYRFVFLGHGNEFEGRVYELPDTSNPLIVLPATDPDNWFPTGQAGFVVASQGSLTVTGDATFDNFLATWAEPRLTLTQSGNSVVLTWPALPFRLQVSPTLSPGAWSDVTTGISTSGDQNSYTAPATGTAYFRLVYP